MSAVDRLLERLQGRLENLDRAAERLAEALDRVGLLSPQPDERLVAWSRAAQDVADGIRMCRDLVDDRRLAIEKARDEAAA